MVKVRSRKRGTGARERLRAKVDAAMKAGTRFGSWTVIAEHDVKHVDGSRRFVVKCACGHRAVCTGRDLRIGHTKGCNTPGCYGKRHPWPEMGRKLRADRLLPEAVRARELPEAVVAIADRLTAHPDLLVDDVRRGVECRETLCVCLKCEYVWLAGEPCENCGPPRPPRRLIVEDGNATALGIAILRRALDHGYFAGSGEV